ncbi:MAG: hypothetical protein SW833_18750 [Cyanobacteriota bacterium]|nr:hypothetical protein [Cyanobacteriota bacterium]
MEYGAKMGTTALIWGFATGMLAICIPLTSVTKSGVILPLATLLGASGSTVAIWSSSRQKSRETAQLLDNVKTLNERVETLEAICASEGLKLPQPSQGLELQHFSASPTPIDREMPDNPPA